MSSPEPALASLPGVSVDLLHDWVARWLTQCERKDVPASLRPYTGFRPGRRDARVGQAFSKELESSPSLRFDLLTWLEADGRKYLDDAKQPETELSLAWLRGDSDGVADVMKSIQALGAKNVDGDELAELQTQLGRVRAQLEKSTDDASRAKREARKATDSKRENTIQHQKALAESQSLQNELEKELRELRRDFDSRRQSFTAEQKQSSHRESESASRIRVLEVERDRALADRSTSRRSSRQIERIGEARLAVLLAAAQSSVEGLRQELGITSDESPAEVTRSRPSAVNPLPRMPGRNLLREWLKTPGLHVLVDGYNVTKTATPELPLAEQRDLLSKRMIALSSRTGAEITLVFDAQHVSAKLPSATRRGVRVIFTEEGEIADDVIVELVSSEPPGRAILVISSDKEVVSAVTRLGARAVSSADFIAEFDRG